MTDNDRNYWRNNFAMVCLPTLLNTIASRHSINGGLQADLTYKPDVRKGIVQAAYLLAEDMLEAAQAHETQANREEAA